MTDRQDRPVYAVTSPGLWAQRRDLEQLLDAEIRLFPLAVPAQVDAFVGWGRRPSGLRAQRLGSLFSRPVISLEDGFLKSYAPGRGEPAQSFVIDRSGIYFDAANPGDLPGLVRPLDRDQETRARAAMTYLREHQLSKYNNAPRISLSESGLDEKRPFVLLVDQVAGDASLAGAMASDQSFAAMLAHAGATYPGAQLAIRTHPAAGDRSLLLRAAERLGVKVVTPARMNPWPLLEAAQAVYTVSSQLGFEALMAGCRVHCFGATYYSHRGLTEDHGTAPAPRPQASLEQLFHAAYIGYSRYLDLHERIPVPLERAMQQIRTVRDQRQQITRRVYTGGLSPWKRRAIDPFVVGPAGRAVHTGSIEAATKAAAENAGQVALWGSSQPLPAEVPAIRWEDGFIRSRGLGANLALPCSLAMDWDHVYYDARGESRLEHIIANHDFPEELQDRARALVAEVVAGGVSKYNVGAVAALPDVPTGRLKILVPGQVEKDASIRYGSPVVRTNRALVAAVRTLFPDAFIAYKEHPDVTSGMRSGGDGPDAADVIVRDGDIKDWIAWCDRVETMTSLTGFEALIRDRAVGVHGMPFYAGWGLTEDRLAIERRKRRISVEMLAAAALILYPFYVHPLSGMPCTPEELVAEIARNRPRQLGAIARLRLGVSQSINRAAVRIRDRRA